MIPMLTLGIPGDTATALLLAALTIHGVQSGPLLMSEGGGVFGVDRGLVLFANVVLLPVSLTGIKILPRSPRYRSRFCSPSSST